MSNDQPRKPSTPSGEWAIAVDFLRHSVDKIEKHVSKLNDKLDAALDGKADKSNMHVIQRDIAALYELNNKMRETIASLGHELSHAATGGKWWQDRLVLIVAIIAVVTAFAAIVCTAILTGRDAAALTPGH